MLDDEILNKMARVRWHVDMQMHMTDEGCAETGATEVASTLLNPSPAHRRTEGEALRSKYVRPTTRKHGRSQQR